MFVSAAEGKLRRTQVAIPRQKARISPFWMRQFHTWHWMSSAICLVGMVLFALTGITLNHAGEIEAEAVVASKETNLPKPLATSLAMAAARDHQSVPPAVSDWLENALPIDLDDRAAEWSDGEVYIPLPRAGGDGWVSVAWETGTVLYEDTDRGWISYLNDLHKGRDTGAAWSWFIDVFATACVVFCLTGLLLLQVHARRRKSTWPIVGAGLIIPLFLIIFLMH